jgi:hypothetical protein
VIKNIKNLIIEITEDYTSDQEQRNKAEDIYNTLLANLNGRPYQGFQYGLFRGFPYALFNYGQFDYKYQKLKFIFLGHRISVDKKTIEINPDSSFAYSRKDKAIFIPVNYVISSKKELETDWQEEASSVGKEQVEKIRNLVDIYREPIIHEIIHYLDDLNYSPTYQDNYKVPTDTGSLEDQQKAMKGYLNQPSEYNAFYQMTTSKLDKVIYKRIKDGSIKMLYDKFFGTYEEFLRLYNVYTSIPANKKYLTDDYFKKTHKRLYQYYENKKREIEESIK